MYYAEILTTKAIYDRVLVTEDAEDRLSVQWRDGKRRQHNETVRHDSIVRFRKYVD